MAKCVMALQSVADGLLVVSMRTIRRLSLSTKRTAHWFEFPQ